MGDCYPGLTAALDHIVSSTAIRRAISSGLLDKAGEMLGRPYSLCGIVEKGYHVAGPELAHPTANLKITCGVLPPDGVYAASAIVGSGGEGRWRECVASSATAVVHR